MNCKVKPNLNNIARLYTYYNKNLLSHKKIPYSELYQPDDLWDSWNNSKEDTVNEYVDSLNTTMRYVNEAYDNIGKK